MVKNKKQWWIAGGILLLFLTASSSGSLLWWRNMDTMPEVTIPTPKMPSPNAYDFYVKAGKAITHSKRIDPIYDPTPIPQSQWKTHYPIEKREAWLRQNSRVFSLLRQGFNFPCLVPPERSYATSLFGNNGHFRELNRILWAESRVHEERGRLLPATQSCIDMIQLGTDITRGGKYNDYIVGTSLKQMGYQRFWELLPRLNSAESRAVIRRLEKLYDTRPTRVAILREEKNYGQALSLEIMQMDGWRTENWSGKNRRKHLYWLYHLNTTSKRTQFKSYTQYIDALIVYNQKPYLNNSPEPAKPGDLFSHLYGSGYPSFGWFYARDEARGSLLLTSLALHLYHSEHERYPKSLNELRPRYLKEIPADPFGDGSPLRYRLTGDKYLLYSIGPDGRDDGGRPIQDGGRSRVRPTRTFVKAYSKGDFVAGINR